MNTKEINACNEVNETIILSINDLLIYKKDKDEFGIFGNRLYLKGIKSQAEKDLLLLEDCLKVIGETDAVKYLFEYEVLKEKVNCFKIAIEVIGREL